MTNYPKLALYVALYVHKVVTILQQSNARRVRSSRHNFTKENTNKCRQFHFNRKT